MSSNINNYVFNKFDLRLSNYEYWDLTLANDASYPSIFTGVTTGTCFVSHFDFDNQNIYGSGPTSADTIYSLISWSEAKNTGYTFNTIGITGIDNGFITFDKPSGDVTNQALLSALTGSTLVLNSGDTKLFLTRVTGTTGQYIYPIDLIDSGDTIGKHAQLCGGFYQGFYKIPNTEYSVLPNRFANGWVAEYWLNKTSGECETYTATTLNDTYPNNKGFFFYIGTRAENKFWNIFNGADTGCTSACTIPVGCTDTLSDWCTIPKETNIVLSDGYRLSPPPIEIIEITNKFLTYNTSTASGFDHNNMPKITGLQVDCSTAETLTFTAITKTTVDFRNPFLIYCEKCGGCNCNCDCSCDSGSTCETIDTFSGFTQPLTELDKNADIIDNALGFRIKDDGSIGYRKLILSGQCSGDTYTTGVTIDESYSLSGVVEDNKWVNVTIRYRPYGSYTECESINKKPGTGDLMFYVNNKLKFLVEDFDEFIPKQLNEYYKKQIGVPFNISLGGGSQGLIETQTFDGRDIKDLGLEIEKNFAGSFIGKISQFKFNICDIDYPTLTYIYKNEKNRYN